MADPSNAIVTADPPGEGGSDRVRFRRALIALDGPDAGPRWGSVLRTLVRDFGTELLVCHVEMRSTSVAGNELDGAPANPEEVAVVQRARALLIAELGEPGHAVPIKVLHGDPGQRICEYAKFAGCDLIVLGSRERSLAQRLRGSVRKYVVGAFDRSVLVVGD